MARRARLGAIGGFVLLVIAGCLPVDRAIAIDIRCIEASKYKYLWQIYLWQIFENNPKKFAEFLGIEGSQLPEPETCRAVVVTEIIEPLSAKPDYSAMEREADKLLEAIARNKGWLAEIFLASPGGNAGSGLLLGEQARLFWLKTNAVDGDAFEYIADFAALPSIKTARGSAKPANKSPDVIDELSAGWRSYLEATSEAARTLRFATGQGRCQSACSYVHSGGVDRRGITYVHRTRAVPTSHSVFAIFKSFIVAPAIEVVMAYLKHMDAGGDVLRKTQSTPAVVMRGSPALAEAISSRSRGSPLVQMQRERR